MTDASTIENVTSRVLATFPEARRVVLFGSRAREQAAPDSDFDLLIVTPTTLRPAARGALLRKALRDLDASFDLLVVTPEEFEQLRGFKSGIVARALAQGTTLHEAA